ncbi:serine hydrolase [Paenibacillus sp. BSR1-1]|uniref:serine hydrolase domain-containing protein n=1 Tax=Paenibacillus sp. BSR1-1 TaxID=3020845 RepID=UPI0025AF4C75|nr:serine hydrolase domain-containing protein [Paenibacillus sp. BSR1-1]MDN3019058.1 serine hydrolase [Paenibacillus sp. BSR1-1]
MNWTLFEEKLHERMEKEHILGAAVAVSQNGKIIYQNGFGVKNLDTKEQVSPNTIFGTASVTKSFTALGIMKLEEEGKLSVDDPVIAYLPEFYFPSVDSMESIKIHHLLTHTAGLAPIRRREELNRFQEHLTYLAEYPYPILGKPGEYLSYCNDTFLLLGAIIERITGRLFRRFITEEVLYPLQMYRSTFSLEELHKFEDVSTPYVYHPEGDRFEKQSWPILGNYEAGGGIRSNVLDLLKYGELYIGQGILDHKPFISKKQLEKMRQPTYPINRSSYYGYALEVTPNYHGFTLVEHSGGQPGVSSNFGFIPEQNLVVAVLTNVSDVPAKDIWLEAVNYAIGIPLEEKRNTELSVDLSEEQLKKFVGTYQSEEGDCLQIFIEDYTVKATINSKEFSMRASGEATLVITEKEKPIQFYFDSNGETWAAFMGLRVLLKK